MGLLGRFIAYLYILERGLAVAAVAAVVVVVGCGFFRSCFSFFRRHNFSQLWETIVLKNAALVKEVASP